jgi:hypothetical protein
VKLLQGSLLAISHIIVGDAFPSLKKKRSGDHTLNCTWKMVSPKESKTDRAKQAGSAKMILESSENTFCIFLKTSSLSPEHFGITVYVTGLYIFVKNDIMHSSQ